MTLPVHLLGSGRLRDGCRSRGGGSTESQVKVQIITDIFTLVKVEGVHYHKQGLAFKRSSYPNQHKTEMCC